MQSFLVLDLNNAIIVQSREDRRLLQGIRHTAVLSSPCPQSVTLCLILFFQVCCSIQHFPNIYKQHFFFFRVTLSD